MRNEDPTFSESAVLHEKTVQAVARGEIEKQDGPRAYYGRTARCTTVRDERVPDAAMDAALALAGGDRGRLKITSEGEVIVLNNTRKQG